jgi:hypothetical protein
VAGASATRRYFRVSRGHGGGGSAADREISRRLGRSVDRGWWWWGTRWPAADCRPLARFGSRAWKHVPGSIQLSVFLSCCHNQIGPV